MENPFGWDVKAREEETLVNGIHQLTVNTKFDKEYIYLIDIVESTNRNVYCLRYFFFAICYYHISLLCVM